jgi:hypothetical protein
MLKDELLAAEHTEQSADVSEEAVAQASPASAEASKVSSSSNPLSFVTTMGACSSLGTWHLADNCCICSDEREADVSDVCHCSLPPPADRLGEGRGGEAQGAGGLAHA